MTKSQVITEVCGIVALAFFSINDLNKSSDCFCEDGHGIDSHFQNDGETIAYVRQAVIEKLRRDGFDVKE